MTEAEAKLIEVALTCWYGDEMVRLRPMIAAVMEERQQQFPYGHIAESMLTEPRKPFGHGRDRPRFDGPNVLLSPESRRDVCDPLPERCIPRYPAEQAEAERLSTRVYSHVCSYVGRRVNTATPCSCAGWAADRSANAAYPEGI